MLARNALHLPRSTAAALRLITLHQLRYPSTLSTAVASSSSDLVLGLRSTRPPDSISSAKSNTGKPSLPPDPNEPVELSDAEWEIRTGRALYVLQETLPEFFKVGLITKVDKSTGAPVKSTSVLPLSLGPSITNTLELYNNNNTTHHEGGDACGVGGNDVDPIYSSKVKLEYTPPTALPSPFPRTLHIEGFPLYLASASFMRHTMNALYSDLAVTLLKVALDVPASKNNTRADRQKKPPGAKKSSLREKSLLVRFIVTGNTRVSKSPSEWEVESTYIFSPVSGLIHKQIINSIHPTPHQAVYDSLSKMFGFGWNTGPGVGKTICNKPE